MYRSNAPAKRKLAALGESQKRDLGPLHADMLRHYEAAVAEYEDRHKSAHWDLFPAEFDAVIRAEDAWRQFRLNGITTGYDQSVVDAVGKTDRVIKRPQLIKRTKLFYDRLSDLAGKDFVDGLLECEIGDPPYVSHEGSKLNVTDLRHIYSAWRITQHVEAPPGTIVEIGGGYGGLLGKLKKIYPEARLLAFDLPEVCAAQTYYLSNLFGQRVAGAADADRREITVLPGWRYAPSDKADLVINSQSMMEMNFSVVQGYFAVIQDSLNVGGLFYCANRYSKQTVGEPIRLRDYPYDARWHFVYSAPMLLQPHVHELIAIRMRQPRVAVDELPPRRWRDVGQRFGSGFRFMAEILIGTGPTTNPGLRFGLRNLWKSTLRWAYVNLKKR